MHKYLPFIALLACLAVSCGLSAVALAPSQSNLGTVIADSTCIFAGEQDLALLQSQLREQQEQMAEEAERFQREFRWFLFGVTFLMLAFAALFIFQNHAMQRSKIQLETMNAQITRKNLELERAYSELDLMARRDPLTHLSNRRDMLERLEYEKNRSLRSRQPFAVAMADLDHFKRVNDTYGHDAGDMVLVALADLFTSTMRRQDIIARWGGEEFLILMPETDISGGTVAMEKIRNAVAEMTVPYAEAKIRITITLGLAEFVSDEQLEECIKRADTALYRGKKNGRNCVVTDVGSEPTV